MAAAGEYACYALCIIEIAKEEERTNGINPEHISYLEALVSGIEKGFIFFDEKKYDSDKNFFVRDPGAFLGYLTGKKWNVRYKSATYEPASGEYAVEFWAWSAIRAQNGIGHFCRPGKNTLQYSKSVADGKCYSKRIFSRV